jgi:hypothetical protein
LACSSPPGSSCILLLSSQWARISDVGIHPVRATLLVFYIVAGMGESKEKAGDAQGQVLALFSKFRWPNVLFWLLGQSAEGLAEVEAEVRGSELGIKKGILRSQEVWRLVWAVWPRASDSSSRS